ncbi:unnamed protein product, partial [Polarella glacialis]
MGQGNDSGSQYRSGLYFFDDDQRQLIEESKDAYQAALQAAGIRRTITTEIRAAADFPAAGVFYYAEDYHQQYLAKPGSRPYCSAQPQQVSLPALESWASPQLLAKKFARAHLPERFWEENGRELSSSFCQSQSSEDESIERDSKARREQVLKPARQWLKIAGGSKADVVRRLLCRSALMQQQFAGSLSVAWKKPACLRIPGVIYVSSNSLRFEPDSTHEHVQEVGVEQYTVLLEVEDLLECGAVAMPVEDSADGNQLSFFLQLQVRTLDGEAFCSSEDMEEAWFVVFRLQELEELYEVATILLDAMDAVKQAGSASRGPSASRTRVPFPCLDCMAELEHVQHHMLLERQLSEEQDKPSAQRRLAANFASFLSGPSKPKARKEESPETLADPESPGTSPYAVEKVVLRLPENLDRPPIQPMLTTALAECLLDYLPVEVRLPGAVEWVLRYTPKAHGVSLSTMFRNLAECEKTVVFIQDTEDFIFGGFAPATWEPSHKFYGSGESFVFSYGKVEAGAEIPEVKYYPCTFKN